MQASMVWSSALLGLCAVMMVLPGCAVFGSRKTPEPDYDVVVESDEIEVRRYEPMILARTTVTGEDFDESGSVAFRRLFDYISGANTSSDKIAMTAPVIQEQNKDGQKIAMTAPVIQEERSEDGSWDVAFVLPSSFTMDTAPRPTNPKIELVQKEARHVATIRFSGRRKQDSYDAHAKELMKWLQANDYEILSEPRYAGYDAPFTLPMFRRNEVLIDVMPPRK